MVPRVKRSSKDLALCFELFERRLCGRNGPAKGCRQFLRRGGADDFHPISDDRGPRLLLIAGKAGRSRVFMLSGIRERGPIRIDRGQQ